MLQLIKYRRCNNIEVIETIIRQHTAILIQTTESRADIALLAVTAIYWH